MPSKSYSTFLKNYKQVNKLKKAYEEELHKNPKRGKRDLDHYTRAAIMFLCSSFEVYFEDVLEESCKILANSYAHVDDLPKQVKKTISKHVRDSNNELEPCIFANNWKAYYLELVSDGIKGLNTPKMHNIEKYVSKYLGMNNLFDTTTYPFASIDDIITERGEIAHRLYGKTYIKEVVLIEDCDTIRDAVKEIDMTLYQELPKIIHKKPWNYTYITC